MLYRQTLRLTWNTKFCCLCYGSGGSSSERCPRLALLPDRLILLERSEPALYAIEQEIRPLLPDGVVLQAVLGSANDPILLQSLFDDQSVDLVFHAAAYKHVPLVEANPLSGLVNNVFSTHQVCIAAKAKGVRQVVLISTDKAVRPTNVMGASKRLAELVLQAHASDSRSTCFAMVRFGNVLGSSGSVVLISSTDRSRWSYHLDSSRNCQLFYDYCWAASLVLQASVLTKGVIFSCLIWVNP